MYSIVKEQISVGVRVSFYRSIAAICIVKEQISVGVRVSFYRCIAATCIVKEQISVGVRVSYLSIGPLQQLKIQGTYIVCKC